MKNEKQNKFTVTLDWEQCQTIAHYYCFPAAVFLYNKKVMIRKLKGARKQDILINLKKLKEKLDNAIEEVL